MPQTFTDVACTVCGCVCDDLTLTVEDGRIVRVERACRLAEPWLLGQNAAAPPAAEVDGKPATVAEAADRAAELLTAARYPLIYGLSRSTTEGQRAAAALADILGATIDTTASTGHAPSIMALQQVGESTCTLGEVKQRADLVVFWGSDPAVTHPRHIERYCPPRPGRTVVVADVRETESAKAADVFVMIDPGRDWEALWTLRLLVAGKEPNPPAPFPEREGGDGSRSSAHGGEGLAGGPFGAPLDRLRELAGRMAACNFGIVFFGTGITQGRNGHRTVEALLQLVTDLNARTRFYARRMRRYGDVAGADSVLAWQTGYPFGVNLSAGYPRYNPGEFTGPDMLARGEADACLIVGGDTAADFPPVAMAHLDAIPTILLDPPGAGTALRPAVKFTTAVYGVHRPGTAYRMDEIPIPLKVVLPTDYPSDGEVLGEILRRVGRRTRPPAA